MRRCGLSSGDPWQRADDAPVPEPKSTMSSAPEAMAKSSAGMRSRHPAEPRSAVRRPPSATATSVRSAGTITGRPRSAKNSITRRASVPSTPKSWMNTTQVSSVPVVVHAETSPIGPSRITSVKGTPTASGSGRYTMRWNAAAAPTVMTPLRSSSARRTEVASATTTSPRVAAPWSVASPQTPGRTVRVSAVIVTERASTAITVTRESESGGSSNSEATEPDSAQVPIPSVPTIASTVMRVPRASQVRARLVTMRVRWYRYPPPVS